jgi:hypothetical protein
MRAPDDFTGSANTGDSGVFTATTEPPGRPLGGGSDGSATAGPRAWCAEATRDCHPLWPVWQPRPLPGSYGFRIRISTLMVAVKAVSWNLVNGSKNLHNFRAFAKAGAFLRADCRVANLTTHAKTWLRQLKVTPCHKDLERLRRVRKRACIATLGVLSARARTVTRARAAHKGVLEPRRQIGQPLR